MTIQPLTQKSESTLGQVWDDFDVVLNMGHTKIAEDLIVRAQYLSTELLISDFQVKCIIDKDEEDYLSIEKDEVESRIRGYVFEGYVVSVDVLDHKVTIIAKDQ